VTIFVRACTSASDCDRPSAAGYVLDGTTQVQQFLSKISELGKLTNTKTQTQTETTTTITTTTTNN
jgi:hypothetical protein